MSEALVIEIDDVTAGIIVGRRGDYRFFSSHPAFDRLDGKSYRNAESATRAAQERQAAIRRGTSRSASSDIDSVDDREPRIEFLSV